MFTNKEKILHLFLTVIKQCTVLMDFSCEKLKSFTAGISLRFVYIHAVFQFPNIFLYMDIRQL